VRIILSFLFSEFWFLAQQCVVTNKQEKFEIIHRCISKESKFGCYFANKLIFGTFLSISKKIKCLTTCKHLFLQVGTTKVKMASTEENLSGEKAEFVARRRLALERFVNRLGQHPVIRRDSNFVEFVESKRDLPRATSTSALSSASVFRLLGKVFVKINSRLNNFFTY
jgi:hypothetical protein